jgi:PLD-like domain
VFEALRAWPVAVIAAFARLLHDYAPSWPPSYRLQTLHSGAESVVAMAQLQAWTAQQLASACQLSVDVSERQLQQALQLVLSGCQSEGVPTRDTAAVVQTLFAAAQKEVVIAGYAFHRADAIFAPLAAKMQANPELSVRIIMDVKRPYQNKTIAQDLVRKASADFWKKSWPWQPRPMLYYDPRALALEPAQHASMHAKFVLVDRTHALITSANFTYAALNKNIEVGVLLCGASLNQQLALFAEALIMQHIEQIA